MMFNKVCLKKYLARVFLRLFYFIIGRGRISLFQTKAAEISNQSYYSKTDHRCPKNIITIFSNPWSINGC